MGVVPSETYGLARRVGRAAKTAALVAAPEVAAPVVLALDTAKRARRAASAFEGTWPQGGGRAHAYTTKPERWTVSKDGRRVTHHPARGVTAGEVIVVAVVAAAGYGAYKSTQAIQGDISSLTSKKSASFNPVSWIGL